MTASLFGTGGVPVVNASGLYGTQSFTATASQTLFTLTGFSYVLGTKSLWVFINGQRQELSRGDYSETSTTSFTLAEGCVAGDSVDVIGFNISTLTTPTNLSGTATFAAATTTTVTFSTPQADSSYNVLLGAGANKTFWVTAKTVNGFTLNASSVSSDSVDWAITR